MIAVIFEVEINEAHRDDYLEMAARMREELKQIDGFIEIERFQSLTNQTKLVSLSYWRDEQAVSAWRNLRAHRAAQRAGRSGWFDDYRLRVAEVSRSYGLNDRAEAPSDSLEAL